MKKLLVFIGILLLPACGTNNHTNFPTTEFVCKECENGLICVDKNIFLLLGLTPIEICSTPNI